MLSKPAPASISISSLQSRDIRPRTAASPGGRHALIRSRRNPTPLISAVIRHAIHGPGAFAADRSNAYRHLRTDLLVVGGAGAAVAARRPRSGCLRPPH